MFVPSLSWQNVRFYTLMAQKCCFSQASLPTTTEGPWKRTVLNPFEAFSATCTYFGVGMVDLGKDTPIGLIQSSGTLLCYRGYS
jgi:hypothetical protein|eukprot:COSAG06_NODE_809_length_12164_cov_17.936179_11_plen_84_part_00